MSDLISRQDALYILKKKMIDRPLDSDRWVIRDIAVEIKSLPSAEPKTGKWVKRQTIGDVSFAYCSECGEPILHGRTSPLWNFCPNCGAKMYKGGDDE